ncbi:MAG TPA: hypothetical protein VFO14_25195 [Vicinamibacterales bacterium]|nr:hypothetical protein [Vicinamibacterales bacterium]
MATLSMLFERFRERRYLKHVTPKTVVWYETAFLALTRAVPVSGPSDLKKPLLHDFVGRRRAERKSTRFRVS